MSSLREQRLDHYHYFSRFSCSATKHRDGLPGNAQLQTKIVSVLNPEWDPTIRVSSRTQVVLER
jgi:hypothetical protein